MAAIAAAQAAPSTIACNVAALKAAINTANGSSTPSTIYLAPYCTYTLTSPDNGTDGGNGLPVVTKTVTLIGSNTTITRSPTASPFRILEVAGSGGNAASLTIQGTTISGGYTTNGGCLLAKYTGTTPTTTTLRLENTEVEGCTAAYGGGINVGAHAVLLADSSKVKGNVAGAIGGGVLILAGAYAKFSNTFVGGNAASSSGGGLYVYGHVTLTSSTLAQNGAGNAGGGLYNNGSASLGATFVAGNQAANYGGGIFADSYSSTSIVATKLQSNQAGVNGGGLYNKGHAFLQNSFVVLNSAAAGGGGIFESPYGSIVVLNTMIVGNLVNNCSPVGSVPFCVG